MEWKQARRSGSLAVRIAEEILREEGDSLHFLMETEDDEVPQVLYEHLDGRVWDKVIRLQPKTLGRIAASGIGSDRLSANGASRKTSGPNGTSMYRVHCGPWLGRNLDGISLLRELARTVIVSKMADRIIMDRAWARRRQPDSAA